MRSVETEHSFPGREEEKTNVLVTMNLCCSTQRCYFVANIPVESCFRLIISFSPSMCGCLTVVGSLDIIKSRVIRLNPNPISFVICWFVKTKDSYLL